jgi:hypothetical protein
VVVSAVDNLRSLVLAGKLAARLRTELVRVNTEPAASVLSVTTYRPGQAGHACPQCAVAHDFDPLNPATNVTRSTSRCGPGNSAKLARCAATIGAEQIRAILDGTDFAANLDRETQLDLHSGAALRSKLTPRSTCPCQQTHVWARPRWLQGEPEQVTLAELLKSAEIARDDQVELRLCHPIVILGRCRLCGLQQDGGRWLPMAAGGGHRCARCQTEAIPRLVGDRFTIGRLAPWLERPLSALGLLPGAIVEFQFQGTRRALAVGSLVAESGEDRS